VAAYGPERETQGAGRHATFAAVVMLVALVTPYLSGRAQQQIAFTLQASVLRPFIATQLGLTEARANADRIDRLQSELDSLTAVVSTQAALVDENRTLRELLGLSERAGPVFLPTTILRPGTPGSESMFLIDVGYLEGVREGAPVVSARGLVGVIQDVRERSAVGMDWTHPDFRVSAMLMTGTNFGIVENARGAFREQDRLLLNGTAYHESAPEGALVVTSGLGGVYPRGIPIGTIEATAAVQGTWLKSYWLRPAVQPGSVTHVLVETAEGAHDLSDVWAADSLAGVTPPRGATPGPAGAATGEPTPRRIGPPPPQVPVPRGDTPSTPTPGVMTAPPGASGVDTVRPPSTGDVTPDTLTTPPDTAGAPPEATGTPPDRIGPPGGAAPPRPDTVGAGADRSPTGAGR
jgi:cell shape-determining protein MreC